MLRYFLVMAALIYSQKQVLFAHKIVPSSKELRCAGSLLDKELIAFGLHDMNGTFWHAVPAAGRQAIVYFFNHESHEKSDILFDSLNRAYAAMQSLGIDFVMISTASLINLKGIVLKYKPLFPILHDLHKRVSNACQTMTSCNVTMFVNERGYVHKIVLGQDVREHLAQIFLYSFLQSANIK